MINILVPESKRNGAGILASFLITEKSQAEELNWDLVFVYIHLDRHGFVKSENRTQFKKVKKQTYYGIERSKNLKENKEVIMVMDKPEKLLNHWF